MNDVNTVYPTETISAATAAIAAKSLDQTVTNLAGSMSRASIGAEQAQAKLKEGAQTTVQHAEKIARFGQGNIEALIKATQIWVIGMQDLSKQVAVAAQSSAHETANVFRTLVTVKSVSEAIDLQSKFARGTAEKMLSEVERLTQASLALSQQTFAPITERVRISGETFGKIV